MSLIFFAYGLSFFMLLKKDKKKAYIFFTLALLASIGMFFYHTTSTLQLNF
jgi:hypothetical protein